MSNDEIKKRLFVSYYSETEIELTIVSNTHETIKVDKIELINDTIVMFKTGDQESRVIALAEILQIL